jgi:hypothetical protein
MHHLNPKLDIRQKLSRRWEELRLWLFLKIGTQMFGCVATFAPDRRHVKAIHFAVSIGDLNASCRRLLEAQSGNINL